MPDMFEHEIKRAQHAKQNVARDENRDSERCVEIEQHEHDDNQHNQRAQANAPVCPVLEARIADIADHQHRHTQRHHQERDLEPLRQLVMHINQNPRGDKHGGGRNGQADEHVWVAAVRGNIEPREAHSAHHDKQARDNDSKLAEVNAQIHEQQRGGRDTKRDDIGE